MPEENFEQQARRKAEEFSMEPKPEVWLYVKAAIAPEERRRRVVFWWWLLPLCLAGGVAVWVVGNRSVSSENKTAAVVVSDDKGEGEKELHSVLGEQKIQMN